MKRTKYLQRQKNFSLQNFATYFNKPGSHTASAEAKTWLRGPNMGYWPQQLNFAVFCATQGCGISREIFDSGFSLTAQIRAFYQFHVYFTVRRVLYQLGGIQSMSALRETQLLINSTTIMTWLHTKGYAPSWGLIHRAIFASQSEKNTGWEESMARCSLILNTLDG